VENNIFYFWGLALLRLAKVKQDKSFEEKTKSFEDASDDIKNSDTLFIKGALYFVLRRPDNEVKTWFEKSDKSILRILTFLDRDNEEKILKTNILYSLLDSNETKDGKIFNKIMGNLTGEQKAGYKEVYIRSMFIISLLHVKYNEEEFVAHYREKNVSQKLLFEDGFKFRLNAVDYSNDPTEGKTLLDFLFGKNNYKTDEEVNTEYEAFASCFVFDYDNSNMFRLYGKENDIKSNREGTGLSLVFGESFFDKNADMAIETPKRNKFSLYRCIYIDPHSETDQPIVTVGQKEEYLFHREKKGGNYKNYNDEMNKTIERVREEMRILKDQASKLNNKDIVGELLLNLRYLVKHVAFKEEQECRIVRIHHLPKNKDIKTDNDFKQMYFEYQPKVSDHIKKIYFGPKAEGFELFKSMLKYKGLEDIECKKSENPLA